MADSRSPQVTTAVIILATDHHGAPDTNCPLLNITTTLTIQVLHRVHMVSQSLIMTYYTLYYNIRYDLDV